MKRIGCAKILIPYTAYSMFERDISIACQHGQRIESPIANFQIMDG